MAGRADGAAGHQRLLGLAAVAALSAGTALAFGRVFAGRLPTPLLVGAALASVAVAVSFERRGLLLATLASLAGLTLAIAWIVLPQTTWYGVPSIRTLRALGRSLEFVGQQARVQEAPTPALPPLMLAAVTAVWTASFSAHALAIRAGSPLLAVLPPIVLVGFADTVLDDGARPIYAAALLGAALAVVFADGLRRVRQWGPVWSGSRVHRFGPSAKGSRSVAAAVIVTAILVPGILPGFRSEPLVDVSTSGTDGLSLNPFVAIQGQLDDEEPRPLFEVESTRSANWRVHAYDLFDGVGWTSDADGSEDGHALTSPATLPRDPADPVPGAETFHQIYRILADGYFNWVPMALAPEQISGPLGEFMWYPERFQALNEGGLESGLEYEVRSRAVEPSPGQLDAAVPLPAAEHGPYTQVPGAVGPGVYEIAERWTEGEPNAYRRVLAIQHRLRSFGPSGYSREPGLPSDPSWLLSFLTETRIGYCVHFATAMAMLVRALGLPARVADGYQPGEQIDDRTYLVRTSEAHMWVEVYFEGYGWLPFEPTPGRGVDPATQTGTYLNPDPSQTPGPGGERVNETAPGPDVDDRLACPRPGAAGGPLSGQLCNAERGRGGAGGAGPLESFVPPEAEPVGEPGYSVPYRTILLGLLAVFALLLVVVPIVKWGSRRARMRRAREPREHVLAAYRVFDGEATDLGLGRRDGETLDEHRARLAASVAFSDGHLGRLTLAASRAAYSPAAPTPEEARACAEDARRAIRDLRRDAGLVRRIVGTYRPGF